MDRRKKATARSSGSSGSTLRKLIILAVLLVAAKPIYTLIYPFLSSGGGASTFTPSVTLSQRETIEIYLSQCKGDYDCMEAVRSQGGNCWGESGGNRPLLARCLIREWSRISVRRACGSEYACMDGVRDFFDECFRKHWKDSIFNQSDENLAQYDARVVGHEVSECIRQKNTLGPLP